MTGEWDWAIVDRLGLPRDVFPEIVKPCTFSGSLSPELQKELGCGPIPIIKVGSHDTASAVAAVPAPEQGNWAYISAGTWALLGAEIERPFRSEESEKHSFTNEGGLDGKIRFLSNIMGSWLFQETRRVWNETSGPVSFAEMEQMALAAEPCAFLINPNDQSFVTPATCRNGSPISASGPAREPSPATDRSCGRFMTRWRSASAPSSPCSAIWSARNTSV
ncbi:Rhamnulokinase [bioreactor metagenome]|uniref:Rhamnulokinase n=1 Tax=bioreactor metagenome TaxID=1076179 RepID=A0A645FDQ6_9ZZZZ